MCLFDPASGARRRALLRDKAVSLVHHGRDATGKVERDLRNRAQGALARAEGLGDRALGRRRRTRLSPAQRFLVGSFGGLLTIYGLPWRGPFGLFSVAAGVALTLRGATGMSLARFLGLTGHGLVQVQKSIHIAAPAGEGYWQFRRYENFPLFMSHVQEVREVEPGRSHWVVAGPAGVPVEWFAEITQEVENDVLAWRTVAGSVVEHRGRLRFLREANNTTRVDVHLSYTLPRAWWATRWRSCSAPTPSTSSTRTCCA